MTVPNNKIKQSYAGDGVTIAFPFTNISYYLLADLDVLIADALGVETVLTQDTDYTVTPVGATLPYTAGTITMIGAHALAPPAAGETVVVYRAVNYTQEIDLSSGGAMPAATLEEGYDRGVMQLQQLYDLLARTVTLPISSPVTGLSLPSPVALQHLRWNASATNLENMDIAGVGDLAVSTFVRTILDETSAAAFLTAIGLDVDLLTLALPANTTISAFIKTLLDDADAAAARTTIDVYSKLEVYTKAESAALSQLPLGYLSGLRMVHDASYAPGVAYNVSFDAGCARDETDTVDMVLTGISKNASAQWAVGTHEGGMSPGQSIVMELMTLDVAPGGAGWAVGDTIHGNTSGKDCTIIKVLTTTTYYVKNRTGNYTLGEVLTNGTDTADQGAAKPTFAAVAGTLHVWLIKRSDTGVVDVMFSNNDDGGLNPPLPTDYDYKRHIGSYRFSDSSVIIQGDWWGTGVNRTFMYDTPILDVSNATPGTNANTVVVSTPGGIVTKALFTGGGASTQYAYISSLDSADLAPSITAAPLASSANQLTVMPVAVMTNTSSQIRYRCYANVAFYLVIRGYGMSL